MGTISGAVLLALTASLLSGPAGVRSGKILVFPVEGSHWVNMNLMIRSLHARGHEVTVVRTTTSWYVEESAAHYSTVSVALPEAVHMEKEDFFVQLLAKMLEIRKGGASVMTFVNFYWEMLTSLSQIHRQASMLVVEMFENKTLMQNLRDARFDLVLMDPGLPGGVLVAHELELPVVYNVRWILAGEGHSVVAPSPLSYVPVSGLAVTDKMTFRERVANMFQYVVNKGIDTYIVSPYYDRLVDKYFDSDVNFYQLLQSADIWLMRVDFVFEFPRPTMPNVVYVGGFQCKPSEPLSSELEEFVQGSGEHGFILMSLGTMIKGLPVEITSEIAAAFARLPQRVIWKHAGEPPSNLGNNTLLVKWLPQNDLLGHAKIRAFVSHCGTNSIYESIYHGVPVIGVPLLFDQFENSLRLEVRGAAKMLDATQITRQNFLDAVQDVLHNPSYRDSMQRLSALHHDRPSRPLDDALYWIEFVMRHKGASHLRTDSYRMPWYSRHCVDVACFLLATLLLLAAAVAGCVRFLCLRLCGKRKTKQE